jgi:hypothetical protein
MKLIQRIQIFFLILTFNPNLHFSLPGYNANTQLVIPVAGNSWVMNDLSKGEKIITDAGIVNWKDKSTRIRTYFRVENTGSINLSLLAKNSVGTSQIQISYGDEKKTITITKSTSDTIDIGIFEIKHPGYQYIEFIGISRSGQTFGEISDILISGPAAKGKVNYVKDDFYFGKRGPSVHLNYKVPANAGDITWFYTELMIPDGNDVEGSYYMANGFSDGYFGIQVNSKKERRILFSVWSPYKSDNPGEIPPEYKITLLKKGPDVITKEFGNEGSGGQSYRKYFWKTGVSYRFLLNGHPSVNNSTDYTAYFYAPENGKWELIASFRRPKTSSYLNNLYSFLENFIPETGVITRKGYYSNQWIQNTLGKWIELTDIKFTADATAKKESRLDYSGGVENGVFFLRNCGFFNDKTDMNQLFSRKATGKVPEIDFSGLNLF